MKKVLDVLRYLFEHCTPEGPDLQIAWGEGDVEPPLGETWESLATPVSHDEPVADQAARRPTDESAIRVFSASETRKLDLQARGFILFLSEIGVLNSVTREKVMDKVLALEDEQLGVEQLKWVALMVLFSEPDEAVALAWMEEFMFDSASLKRIH